MTALGEPLSAGFPALVLLGAALNLDKQAFGHFMAGRPLVTGLLLGLAAGEVPAGVWLGLSTELLWLATLPLGGLITPNSGLAVSVAFIAWRNLGPEPAEAALVLTFLTVPLWAKALAFLDLACRRLVPPTLARARADVAAGREPHFLRRNLHGLFITLGLSAAALAGASWLSAQAVETAIRLIPAGALANLGFIFGLAPFIGLVGMAVFLEARTFPFYLGGLLASLLALSAV